METFYIFLGAQLLFMGYQSIKLRNLKKSIGNAQNKYISIVKKNDIRLHELYLFFEKLSKTRTLPPHLKHISLADEEGIVLSVKTVDIPGVLAPYNAALLEESGGYNLFFRYDTPLSGSDTALYGSHIGCICLDKDFEPIENTFFKIETGSSSSEDARVFQHENQRYLLFNDVVSGSKRRGMQIALFDAETKCLNYVTSLELSSEPIEKNWTPFVYKGSIYFLYTISPQQIVKLSDLTKNDLRPVSICSTKLFQSEWSRRWGLLRGGTPAQLVGGEYLAFFHSAFEDAKGIKWYVMGAYTFEASPPFRMTRISPHPILFKGVYETEILHSAHPGVRSLYPVGFVCEEREGRNMIHVSCGENDSVIKIITMDQDRLLASLLEI